MNDLFKDIKEETLEDGIKVFGPKGIYAPGIHEIVDTNIYVYDVTYGDKTWTTAEVIVTDSKGATLTNQLNTEAKGRGWSSVCPLTTISISCDILFIIIAIRLRNSIESEL
jgi:hypothetical protein